MNRDLMFKNYKKSLEQKYNAVCFDIDGTLTQKGSKSIDDRAIEMITELLKRKVPVVFITGRGETGLKDLIDDIYERIINNSDIVQDDLKRIYVLTNDGARLFYSQDTAKDDFLKENIYISTDDELNQLSDFNSIIVKLRNNLKYSDYFNMTYSKDLKDDTIINIRLVFNENDDNIVDSIFDIVSNFINESNYNALSLTRGIYRSKPVIQIGTATKDKAIERAEKIISVPQNSMIRIGDCGDIRGNDYAMLNCSQGYSVDKISGDDNSCFPIFDDEGNILSGMEATLHLVKTAKILPTVCLEKAVKNDYVHHFASVEESIVVGRNKLLSSYNSIINDNFNDVEGINSLFDKYSGSIQIPMYEWELLRNNPLKELWESSDKSALKYAIRDNENYLLRGSKTYYYFLSNRISVNGKDVTSKDDIVNWHTNYLEFLVDSLNAISITENVNNKVNKKLILGVLDNCRNILLILMNHKLVSNYYSDNALVDISSAKNTDFYNIYQTLIKVELLMSNVCFKLGYLIDKNDVFDSIKSTMNILADNLKEEVGSVDKKDYSKDYRTYREIDNFGENYVAVSLYNEKCNNYDRVFNSCGLSYGGIELPIISKIINHDNVDKLLLLKFNKEVSGYSNKQLIDLRKFNINNFGGLVRAKEVENSSLDLFDDNVLTGKTLQLAINSLYDFSIDVKNICIVRYPSINRINQMFVDNCAAVDYNLFFQYIYGLCFRSPYSWKDNEWKDENGRIDYTDTLGVFDVNRKKIIECLIKNHDFKENSEVGECKRRLVR